MTMTYRSLGRTGVQVSPLCLGCMNFGGRTDAETSTAIIHRALEAGINFIDTANVYGHDPQNFSVGRGRSEEIIAKALQNGRRQKVTLATKVRFGASPEADMGAGLSRRVIMDQVEGSLRRLGTDVIDLYYMHGWDPHTPIAESLRAFDDLVRDGKVRYIGVSNFKAWQVMQALGL
ncbi:MAG: aldo/keto reductase, partial [Chloroflexota bacterium]